MTMDVVVSALAWLHLASLKEVLLSIEPDCGLKCRLYGR